MMFPIQVKREKIVFSTGPNTIAPNLTRYLQCVGEMGEILGNTAASEPTVFLNYLVTRDGVIRNLVVKASTAPGVGQGFVYAVRVNGVNTTLQVSLIGVAVDNSNLVDYAQVHIGDRISLMVITTVAAATTTHSACVEIEINMIREKRNYVVFSSYTTTIAAGVTTYLPSAFKYVSGNALTAVETDIRVNYLVVRKATLKNLVSLALAAAGVGQSFVYTVRVNGAPTALTVTVSGGAQVTNYNSTVIVTVNPSDRVTLEVAVSAGAAARSHACAFDLEEGDLRGES